MSPDPALPDPETLGLRVRFRTPSHFLPEKVEFLPYICIGPYFKFGVNETSERYLFFDAEAIIFADVVEKK